MANRTKRTVLFGLFDYTRIRIVPTQQDGKVVNVEQPYVATALRGDVIEVDDIDLERGERLGALIDGPLPSPAAPRPAAAETPEVSGGSEPAAVTPPEGGHLEPVDPAAAPATPNRPKNVATVGVWREYAVKRGTPPEEADQLSKDEIIAKYPA